MLVKDLNTKYRFCEVFEMEENWTKMHIIGILRIDKLKSRYGNRIAYSTREYPVTNTLSIAISRHDVN